MKTLVKEKFSNNHPIQAWLSSISPQNATTDFSLDFNQPEQKVSSQNNMLKAIKFLLYFGKIVGILPINGLFTAKSTDNLAVRKFSIAGFLSLAIISLLAFQFVLTIYAFLFDSVESSPHVIAQSIRPVIFSGAGLFVVVFLYRNAEELIDCIRQWENTETIFHKEDPHLAISVNLLTGLMMLSAIGENLIAHANVLVINSNEMRQGVRNKSIIQDYWEAMQPEKANVMRYDPVIAVILFITNKFTAYAWNFGDLLVSACAIQLYRRFQLQNESMLEHVSKLNGDCTSQKMWMTFVQDYEKLASLLRKFRSFLSPLVFAVAFSDIFFMAMHVSYFFRETRQYDIKYLDYRVWKQVYFCWGFAHIVARVFVTFISCGKVNKHAHGFTEVLDKCPPEGLVKEVERTELKLRTDSLGLSGLNLFTITDSFILVALNVMFTVEIVLLQSSIGTTAPPQNKS